MSRIAGLMIPKGKKIVLEMLEKMKHPHLELTSIWEGTQITFGTLKLKRVKERPGPLPGSKESTNIIMDGRIVHPQGLIPPEAGRQSHLEKIIDTFNQLGIKTFELLEGEFALAIAERNRLILARDHLGISPLYYGFHNGHFCFASEIKALVEVVEEIKEFPPGHFFLSNLGLFPFKCLIPEEIEIENPQESTKRLYDFLEQAVTRSLSPTIKEIGVWLSGGIDSSAIAALAKNHLEHVHTFSAGVEGAPDLEYSRLVAQYLGTHHHERLYSLEEMLKVLDKVIYHLESFDAPLIRSAIGNYLVAELSTEHVPFVLSGEGGDELFAGYDYQKNCQGEVELTLCMQEAMAALHNTALQRVDRSACAHGLGVATPFLDPDLVRYALAIPARWKIREKDGLEKWPLRQALAGYLPDEVVNRKKEKFWQGAGVWDIVADYAEQKISDEEFARERELTPNFQLRSKEELLYYQIFKSFFGNKIPLDKIGRTQHI